MGAAHLRNGQSIRITCGINEAVTLNLLIDSTGIKAKGEGEWNARKHGGPKRRIWRKIHIGIDEETLEVWADEFTTNNIGDACYPNF